MRNILENYCLNVALLSWLIAQVLKTLINFIMTRKFHAERLFGAGGMPSAHTATVCGLTVALAKQVGIDSPEFAIGFILACVVMYDAMNVRREAGEHAKVLNKVVGKLMEDEESRIDLNDDGRADSKDSLELQEYIGHTPVQVLGGALLGIMVAIIVPM